MRLTDWSSDVCSSDLVGGLNYQNPCFEDNDDLNWMQHGVSLDLRRHFIAEGRSWNPYLLAGLGYQRPEEEYDAFPNPDSPRQVEDGNFAAKVGAGVQSALSRRVGVRAELAYRVDFNDSSFAAPNEDHFVAIPAPVAVVVPLGPEPTAPNPPPP